jgi:hypothetical protein
MARAPSKVYSSAITEPLLIKAIIFKRNVKAKWENGIILGANVTVIDMEGEIVPFPVFDWLTREVELRINYRPPAPKLKG